MGGQTISTSETRAEALKFQSSAYAVTIPMVFGVTKITGNVIWYGGFKAVPHTKTQGGKGGGTKVQTTTYTYQASIAMGLGYGPITGIPRIWRGKKLYSGGVTAAQVKTSTETYTPPASGPMTYTVANAASFKSLSYIRMPLSVAGDNWSRTLSRGTDYSVSASGVVTILRNSLRGVPLSIRYQWTSGAVAQTALDQLGLTFLRGDIAQPAWSAFSDFPAERLGYSGLAFLAGQDYDLGTGAQVENHTMEVVASMAYHLGETVPDVDPSVMLLEVLTNTLGGASFPADLLDDWSAWSDFCVASGLLVSPALTEQQQAADIIRMAAQLTNTGPVWSGGRLKMVPYADEALTANGRTFTPSTTPVYDLDDDCFIVTQAGQAPLAAELKSPADRYNYVRVQFLDRANQYNPAIADAPDKADIEVNGKRPMDIVRAPWICEASTARLVAQLLLQRSLQVCARYKATLPWHFALLEPMDIVTLTNARLQMTREPARVIVIEENDEGDLAIEFEEFPAGQASAAIYPPPSGVGYAFDYNVSPGSADAPVIFEAPAAWANTGLALLVAVKGAGANWGGAQVWVSQDGTNYKMAGVVYGSARTGTLSAVMTVGATSAGVQGLGAEQLLPGSLADAQALNTLCFVGGANPEYFAHQGATLTGAGAYTLSGLVRGAYGSIAAAHAIGDAFVRVDDRVIQSEDLDPSMIGKTVYVKLCSFNVFQGGQQSLADVSATTYTITGGMYARGSEGTKTYFQESAPTAPLPIGTLWTQPSTAQTKRWNGTSWDLWSNIGVQGRQFRVISTGYSSTSHPATPGLQDADTGTYVGSGVRSYGMARIRRSDRSVTFVQYYDVYAAGADPGNTPAYPRGAAQMVADLNATTADSVVVVWTSDEPLANRLTAGLPEALYRCGASRAVFGSPQFKSRGAYVLIGIGGCGEGNGFEQYQGAADSDPNAWCDVSFLLTVQGQLVVSGTGATPRTLADYSYTGDLAATSDLRLVGSANVVISGNAISCSSAPGGAWTEQAYTAYGYTGGAFAQATVAGTAGSCMFGLNVDPTTNASYTSIDYAIYLTGAAAEIYESGTLVGSYSAYALGDVFAVTFDGAYVRYWKNGTQFGPTRALFDPTRRFHFDSSVGSAGGALLRDVRFGPLSAVAGIGTSQISPNALTDTPRVEVNSDLYTFPASVGPQDRAFSALLIANTFGRSVTVEVTVTGYRKVTNPAGLSGTNMLLCWVAVQNVGAGPGGADLLVSSTQDYLGYIAEGMTAGQVVERVESTNFAVELPVGATFRFTPRARVYPSTGSTGNVQLETKGYTMRIAVIKG